MVEDDWGADERECMGIEVLTAVVDVGFGKRVEIRLKE